MDTTNCPAGYATDGVFLYGDDFVPNSCGANLIFFVVAFAILSVFRCAVASVQFKVWRKRETEIQKRTGKKRSRMPVFPLVSLMQATALFMYTILASLNIANAKNGITGLLLGLFYTPMLVAGVIMCIRLVRLGKKLIPLSKKFLASDSTNTSDALQQSTGDLAKADSLLKLCFSLAAITATVHPAALVVAGPIRPIYLTFQFGAASLFAQDILLCFGVSYQYQRLISAVKRAEYPRHDHEVGHDKIMSVLRKMRTQQVIWSLSGATASIIWILNISRAVLPYYWYTLLHFGVEVVFTTFSTYSMASKAFSKEKSATVSTDSNRAPNGEAPSTVQGVTVFTAADNSRF